MGHPEVLLQLALVRLPTESDSHAGRAGTGGGEGSGPSREALRCSEWVAGPNTLRALGRPSIGTNAV